MSVTRVELVKREAEFRQGRHWCSKCQQYLPLDRFGVMRSNRFGLKCWCKACRKKYQEANSSAISERHRMRYRNNRDSVLAINHRWRLANKEQIRDHSHQRLAGRKAKCVELAGGVCQRCGYDEFNTALCFHHVDPQEKDCLPSKAIYNGSLLRARMELDKCVLLCRNCHQALHAGSWTGTFIKKEGLGWGLNQQTDA